ncbi:MAG: hypothetical protein U5K69_19815 [Balneolaceae bacterium]|nr:hypothetical protein [Balneolaceae bacterium]
MDLTIEALHQNSMLGKQDLDDHLLLIPTRRESMLGSMGDFGDFEDFSKINEDTNLSYRRIRAILIS